MSYRTYVSNHIYDCAVDEQGFIVLDGRRLAPAEAIGLALSLAQAVEHSQWRDQSARVFTDTEAILRRARSPLGQAIAALRKVFT